MDQNSVKKDKRERQIQRAQLKSKMRMVLGVLLVIAGIGGFVWLSLSGSSKKEDVYANTSNRELALTCEPGGMAENFHIHPTLEIIINGSEYRLPENIGVTRTCMHPLHTHGDIPNIHVEAPVQRDFTLGDFFAVWNQPFSKEQILEYKADSTHTIKMTVNGNIVDTYQNTVLRDKDRVVITYEGK